MSRRLLSSLRPYICTQCRTRIAPAASVQSRRASSSTVSSASKQTQALDNAETVERRIVELGGREALQQLFPRWQGDAESVTLSAWEFSHKYSESYAGEGMGRDSMTVYGRVTSHRILGTKLLHLELSTSGTRSSLGSAARVQLNYRFIRSHEPDADSAALKVFSRKVKQGDWIVITGCLDKDAEGRFRLNATQLPLFLAPSLQVIPAQLTDLEFRMRNRHVDQIVNPSSRDIIHLRSRIINGIRNYLLEKEFVEVSTPLLVAGAGGAIARPFQTVATEFLGTTLNLRVAPELFLKRMIVGGMPKVFEIGPAFRNEGVDATHNPEFTICEFYSVMATLEDLITTTEDLFATLRRLTAEACHSLPSIPTPDMSFTSPFPRLEFIPSLEHIIRTTLPTFAFPDLHPDNDNTALTTLTETAITLNVPLPLHPTLPRLLDAFAAHYLEPLCRIPTFITHHPECMSPLAKSFAREPTSPGGLRHRVAARAELFVRGRELVNCYEEENSPVEQRRKFEQQLLHRVRRPDDNDGRHDGGDDNAAASADDGDGAPEDSTAAQETHATVDESYLRALEWGMPPTGGWGCGVDRLVMLFGAKGRIADVLPFGSLRNVVGLGRASAPKAVEAVTVEAGRVEAAKVESRAGRRERALRERFGREREKEREKEERDRTRPTWPIGGMKGAEGSSESEPAAIEAPSPSPSGSRASVEGAKPGEKEGVQGLAQPRLMSFKELRGEVSGVARGE